MNGAERGQPLLEVADLVKYFPIRRGIFQALTVRGDARRRLAVRAVDGVSLYVSKGEIVGVVGESGCGKTTMGRAILRLVEPDSGRVLFDNRDVTRLGPGELKALRRKLQIIFQDPYESMNPRLNLLQIISEPLRIQGVIARVDEAADMVLQALRDVEMVPPEDYLYRYPHELSGGQRQRAAVARALVLNPEFIVADEPVSMLDVSIRGEILNLMLALAEKRGVAFVYITHDLATARHICHRISVMYLGKIVEEAQTEELVKRPLHPYTQALLGAVLIPDPKKRGIRVWMKGEVPNPVNPPPGCRLHPRCPKAVDRCSAVEPVLAQAVDATPGHRVACHLVSRTGVEL